jgi:N-acetyl-alpha-D-muramate 1-phosphate uridylyltransferase
MILAAGRGTRMRPLTDHTAKPLLPLGGKPLIDHALDRLAEAGIERVVVNGLWQADRLATHLAARRKPPETVLRREEALLDTGGGIRAALPLLGSDPFFVVNGDAFWLNGPHPTLERLAEIFAAGVADDVLLVHRTCQVEADVGLGDFALDKWGNVRRRRQREVAPYVYAGVHLLRPDVLDNTPDGPFSMNLVWNRLIAAGRLRAVVHDGLWFHLSTPADLSAAESLLHDRLVGGMR